MWSFTGIYQPRGMDGSSLWNKGDQVRGRGRAGQEDLTDDGDMELREMICRMSCYGDTGGHPSACGFSHFSRLDIFTILEFVDSVCWMLKNMVWARVDTCS